MLLDYLVFYLTCKENHKMKKILLVANRMNSLGFLEKK